MEAASSSFIRASYVGDIIARTDLHRRSVENLSHHFLVEANIICICIKQYGWFDFSNIIEHVPFLPATVTMGVLV